MIGLYLCNRVGYFSRKAMSWSWLLKIVYNVELSEKHTNTYVLVPNTTCLSAGDLIFDCGIELPHHMSMYDICISLVNCLPVNGILTKLLDHRRIPIVILPGQN